MILTPHSQAGVIEWERTGYLRMKVGYFRGDSLQETGDLI